MLQKYLSKNIIHIYNFYLIKKINFHVYVYKPREWFQSRHVG